MMRSLVAKNNLVLYFLINMKLCVDIFKVLNKIVAFLFHFPLIHFKKCSPNFMCFQAHIWKKRAYLCKLHDSKLIYFFIFLISALEFCDESHRIYPLFCLMASYSISSILTPVLAMYLPSWQSLLMVATFPNIIVIIAGLCGCIPESIRWQVCEGKAQDVFETVVKIADFNKVKKFGVSILYFQF